MRKYLAVFPLLIALALYISRQDHIAAKQCEKAAALVNQGLVSPIGHAENADECAKNAERNSPIWYSFFRWPNGTTTWAIILTLLAIAEQTDQTRQTADIAKRTLIATLRPQLIVRKIAIHRGTEIPIVGEKDAERWTFDYEIANIGQGTATDIQYGFTARRLDGPLPPRIAQVCKESLLYPLQPGEGKDLSIPLDDQLTSILRHIGSDGLRNGYQNTDKMWFFGTVRYSDENGIRRNLSVCRRYDNKTELFVPDSSRDRDCSD